MFNSKCENSIVYAETQTTTKSKIALRVYCFISTKCEDLTNPNKSCYKIKISSSVSCFGEGNLIAANTLTLSVWI
jgi:hypothetical protein